ncbi:MAG: CHAT domain-containing protein, partial [Bacteroidota bacterium]
SEQTDSLNDGFLTVAELFNLNLNADLVVLSACETGTGRLYRGEGIASLARGFSYAGASSILTSLWSVNDAATARLMQSFYLGLEQGLPKDIALQQAKLQYIESGDHLSAHPFFWSGFVNLGSTEPLDQGKSGRWWLILLGLSLLLSAGWILRKRIQNSTSGV